MMIHCDAKGGWYGDTPLGVPMHITLQLTGVFVCCFVLCPLVLGYTRQTLKLTFRNVLYSLGHFLTQDAARPASLCFLLARATQDIQKVLDAQTECLAMSEHHLAEHAAHQGPASASASAQPAMHLVSASVSASAQLSVVRRGLHAAADPHL